MELKFFRDILGIIFFVLWGSSIVSLFLESEKNTHYHSFSDLLFSLIRETVDLSLELILFLIFIYSLVFIFIKKIKKKGN